MTVIKEIPHVHEWGKNLHNPIGQYWFRICEGFIKVKKGKIERDVRCGCVDRWTTIIARRSEIQDVKDESRERIIQRRSEDID